jgi:predicted GNAT family acetyltransferase
MEVDMLTAKHFRDAEAFLDSAGERLRMEETRYGLILGVCERLASDPHEYGTEDPWFLSLEEDGKVCAVALRTPPYKLLVATFSGDPSQIAERLVAEVSSTFDEIPGVVGEPGISGPFARAWSSAKGCGIEGTMHQRVYSLSEVGPVRLSAGKLRRAGEEDKELVTRWVAEFQEDIFGEVDEGQIAVRAGKQVDRGEVYFWEDGEPVSMSAACRPTGDAVSIGLVYTPPHLRNHGYASSCVATLCEVLLASGYRYCMLYTDLSNPTSNSIYKRIGFTEVCDSADYSFGYG